MIFDMTQRAGGGGGSSGVYVGTTAPDASLGVDGDYYYKRKQTMAYAANFDPNWNAHSALSGGWSFTTGSALTVYGIRFFARETDCSANISLPDGTLVKSVSSNNATVDTWNDLIFDSPVSLAANTTYVVWGNHPYLSMKYYNRAISPTVVTYNGGCYATDYNTFPAIGESDISYAVDLIISIGSVYKVTDEFFKQYDMWNVI